MWNNSHYQLSERHCKMCNTLYTPWQWQTRSLYCSDKCRNFAGNSAKSRIVDEKKIQCAICWRYYRKPWSHVWNFHGVTAREYREEYGFDVKRWQVTDDLREVLRDNVFSNGTVKNLSKWAVFRFEKWHTQNYERSEQTLERLRNMPQTYKKGAKWL